MAELETTPEVKEQVTATTEVTSATEHSTKEVNPSPLNRMINRYKPVDKSAETKAPVKMELKEELLKDLKPEEIKKFKEMPLDENMRIMLIETHNNMQKYNRLQSERDVRIKELEKAMPSDERTKEQQEFIDGLKTDFRGTIEKYKDKYELPDLNSIVSNLQKTSELEGKMSQYQEKELVPKLEKKYKLEEGTFVYDPNDAYKPNTPSYEYRVATEKQEKVFIEEQLQNEKKSKDALKVITEERANQIADLYKELYPEQEIKAGMTEEEKAKITEANQKGKESFQQMLAVIDTMFDKMKEAKSFSADVNPFAIKNIFRGVHFETLTKSMIDKAVAEVHAEYKAKGFYLPDNNKPPVTNASGISGKAPIPSLTEERLKRSPLARSINRTIK